MRLDRSWFRQASRVGRTLPPRPQGSKVGGQGQPRSGGSRARSEFSPTARCVGGPLPRPAVCSFLATAGDPSPNFGGGVVGMVRDAVDGVVRGAGAPLPDPPP